MNSMPHHFNRVRISTLVQFSYRGCHFLSSNLRTIRCHLPSLLVLNGSKNASSSAYNKNEKKKNVKTNLFTIESLKQRKRDIRKRIKWRREQRENSKIEVDSSYANERKKAHWEHVFDSLATGNSTSAITDVLGGIELIFQEQLELLHKKKMASFSAVHNLSTKTDPLAVFLNRVNGRDPKNILQTKVLKQILLAADHNLQDVLFDLKEYANEADRNSDLDDEDIRTIMATREQGIYNDLFWSNRDARIALQQRRNNQFYHKTKKIELHKAKNESMLKLEAKDMLIYLKHNMPHYNFKLLMAVFEAYARDNKKLSASACHAGHAGDFIQCADALSPKTYRVGRSWQKLGNVLFRCAGSNFHLISEKLASFFYLEINENYPKDVNEHSCFKNIVVLDSRFQASIQNWKSEKARFAEVMLNIGAQFDKKKIDESVETRLSSEIQGPVKACTAVSNNDRPFRRHSYARFEASVNFDDERKECIEHTVVIDNLPIDITAAEIREFYSRCGVLKNVLICNKRPDLDPGPLSRAQLADMRKKRFSYTTTRRQKWKRPRTPVYALLSFENHIAYEEVSNDSLRIFGVLIRKHNVRTIRTNDLKNLYLQNIPNGSSCKEMEQILSKIMAPNIFVAMSQGQNPDGLVGSCEVRFPSFDVAYKAFDKMQLDIKLKTIDNMDFSQCSINWLRTPPDAELWWSRQLGFD